MVEQQTRLLVVEDDHECRLLISHIMSRAGFHVEAVADGRMALSIIQNYTPDLVLLDANLPGIDGWEVCRTMKRDERTRKTPVLILTGNATPDTYDKVITCGAEEFMTKPFKNARLVETVKRMLGT
jgi:two-component system, OmpR family, alkaline phosphatase synthesis response regulator PhoP